MKKIPFALAAGAAFALASPAAFAATSEDTIALVTEAIGVLCVAFVLIVALAFYFLRSQDQRRSTLRQIFDDGEELHTVAPDTPVSDCVRMMSTHDIGSILVLEGEALRGIFTERDAMKRVLAAGLDPARTRVGDVMTRDPMCISPSTSVGEAMRVVTERRFRHLPVTENGKLLGMVSSGDMTRWLVKERLEEAGQTVRFAIHPVASGT
jgi:CBS domain-containing protein